MAVTCDDKKYKYFYFELNWKEEKGETHHSMTTNKHFWLLYTFS